MKATVVSTLPFRSLENKPGLIPAYFEIPAAPKDGIATTTIKDGYVLLAMPLMDTAIKSPVLGENIARSIVEDYISSSLAVSLTPDENTGIRSVPGMFWVPGDYPEKEVAIRFKDKVELALKETRLWFANLVKMADDDWQKHHLHKAISDLQRNAVNYLGWEREWNIDPLIQNQNRCWSCKNPFHAGAMVCGTCKAILDHDKWEMNKNKFANV